MGIAGFLGSDVEFSSCVFRVGGLSGCRVGLAEPIYVRVLLLIANEYLVMQSLY